MTVLDNTAVNLTAITLKTKNIIKLLMLQFSGPDTRAFRWSTGKSLVYNIVTFTP